MPGWELRLQQVFEGRREAPFSWGSHDCCQLALAAYEACTGRRVPVDSYDTQRGAARVLCGMGGLVAAVAATGSPEVAPPLAQRGDVVLIEQVGVFGLALAVCAGRVVYAAGSVGLVEVPRARQLRAWSI